MHTDLSKFDIGNYKSGPKLKVVFWYIINYYIFNSSFPWPYTFKTKLLRLFGAKVGIGIIIKTKVRIKYPWRLSIGDHSWIGESVWIDNLEQVEIGSHVNISQGALLLTGNHDYTIKNFPYRLGNIKIEDGVWIGAKSIVCPNIICKTHSILTVNSVATKDLAPWSINTGNPAVFIRKRVMKCQNEFAEN